MTVFAERDALIESNMLSSHMPICRFCSAPLRGTFVDLCRWPLCESFLRNEELNGMEAFYPLHVRVCRSCFLVQLETYVSGVEIFTEYAYFSSFSDSFVEHARQYTELAIDRLALNESSFV